MGGVISVVIPAYNEAPRLPATLRRIHAYLSESALDYEIVVVDDGSSDSTAEETLKTASELKGIRLLDNETNRGKGYSVRKGVLASRGRLVLISDADLSTPIEEMEKLLPFVRGDFDMAVGSRAMEGSELALRQPWYREKMGKAFNLMVRAIAVRGINDTQCGFKLMKGDAARKVFGKCRLDGFSFDVEALFVAKRLGYKIKEVPVRWLNSPVSRVKLLSDPAKMFVDLLRIRVYQLLGYYG
ncbi:MAG: glycosyltransferase family 2 protein [Nitrospirota bacterium]|jgi:dolichyl-phosphate beta-glucosyltransferase